MSSETDLSQIRQAVRQLCEQYGEDYWLQLDRDRGYPSEFVQELSEAGFLNILIPEAYGGAGLGVLNARKTAKARVLGAEAWARTPSIERTGVSRPVCEAARSAAADSACLGSGSATRTLVHHVRRTALRGGWDGRSRCLWQAVVVC